MALLKHTGFNLIGLGVPLLVAVFSIPPLIQALGVARFGLLTLIWAVSSYFGLFDLGLGRALTQQLAGAFARREGRLAGELAATGLLLMAVIGMLAGLALAAVAPWAVGKLRDVQQPAELLAAAWAMCWAMPALVLTPGLRAVLEAQHRFGLVNLIRLPMGLFTFIGPLGAVWLGHGGLDTMAWVLAGGRWLFCAVHGFAAWHSLKPSATLAPRWAHVPGLCASGGWLSVGNVVAPFIGYVDRFAVGLLVSAAAVAHYATPQELVTKLWIIPGALTGVLFPAFAIKAGLDEAADRLLFRKSLTLTYAAMLPLTLALALFSHELLQAWLGADMAHAAALPLRVFAIGMFVNAMATIPYTMLQAIGRARTTAMLHLVQLPVFVAVLWALTTAFGLQGAVAAWFLRIAADSGLMFHFGLKALGGRLDDTIRERQETLRLAVLAVLAFAGIGWPLAWARGLWWTLAVGAMALLLLPYLRQLRIGGARRAA